MACAAASVTGELRDFALGVLRADLNRGLYESGVYNIWYRNWEKMLKAEQVLTQLGLLR
jgi:hypothetical protein